MLYETMNDKSIIYEIRNDDHPWKVMRINVREGHLMCSFTRNAACGKMDLAFLVFS